RAGARRGSLRAAAATPAATATAPDVGVRRSPYGSTTSWGGPRCPIPTTGFPRSPSSPTRSSGARRGSSGERLRRPRTRRAVYCAGRRSRSASASVLAAPAVTLAVALGRTPVWNPPSSRRSTLPADGERAAVRALAALPTGAARALLIDLLRRADAVTAAGDGASRLEQLVIAACDAARDLAALEQHLAAFDARRDRLADAPPGWLDALSRCERGRDVLTQ